MYHTTGLDKAEILDLCEMINRDATADEWTWPPILGLYKSVVVTLTYLRRNRERDGIERIHSSAGGFPHNWSDTGFARARKGADVGQVSL